MNKFLVLAVFVILLIPSATYANLLINPGFETGDFLGWGLSGASGSQFSINNWGRSGDHSAAIRGITAGGYQEVNISNPDLPTKIGGWSYLDVTGNEGLQAQIIVEFRDAYNYFLGSWNTSYYSNTGHSWHDMTTTLVPSQLAGQGITKAAVTWLASDFTGGSAGQVVFDDFEISPVPEPTSLLLLGTGLLGLRALGRKKGQK